MCGLHHVSLNVYGGQRLTDAKDLPQLLPSAFIEAGALNRTQSSPNVSQDSDIEYPYPPLQLWVGSHAHLAFICAMNPNACKARVLPLSHFPSPETEFLLKF